MDVVTQPCTGSSHRIPYHPDVGAKDMARAEELHANYDSQRARALAERYRLLADAVAQRRARLRELIGADAAFNLSRYKRRLRHEEALRQRTEGRLDLERLAADRKSALQGYAEAHDIDLHEIHEALIQLIATFELPNSLLDWSGEAGTVDYGGISGTHPARRITSFTPPFTGWQHGSFIFFSPGFRVNATEVIDPGSGLVGNVVTLDDTDADDSDDGLASADTQVAFWYRTPATGLVEVTINAACCEAHHYLRVKDEWGESFSKVTQASSFMAHVLHPNVREPSTSLISHLSVWKDTSTHRDDHPFIGGQQLRSSPLVSDGTVPADTWIVIRAGQQTLDFAETDDMEVRSRSEHSWYIQRIDVRTLPQ